jgi:hypothetical protein
MNEYGRLCGFCIDRGLVELAVSAEITTSGLLIFLCGGCLDEVCNVRAIIGIDYKQPLPTPGVPGSAFEAYRRELKVRRYLIDNARVN